MLTKVFPIKLKPGKQAQADWATSVRIMISHDRRVLSWFVLVLSWSRAVYARFGLDEALESFLRGHVGTFAALHAASSSTSYAARVTVVCLCPTAIMRWRRENESGVGTPRSWKT